MKTETVYGLRWGRRKAGQTFIVVMMLTGILMIAGASLTFLTSNAAFRSRKINSGSQAQAVAEAGIADRISKMSMPPPYGYIYWALRTNSFEYAGGTSSITGRQPTNSMKILIASAGRYGPETREAILELSGDRDELWDLTVGVDGAIICGGDVTLGNPATINGDIRSNGQILQATPADPTVNGDIQTQTGVCEISPSGSTTTGAPPITVPDMREDFPIWRARAIAGPAPIFYFTNDQSWSSVVQEPGSGVIFVEGNIDYGERCEVVGTIVATGYIHINNQWNKDPQAFDPSWPALIAGLDVDDRNLNNYHGTIFGATSVTLGNNRDIEGNIISLGPVTITGNETVTPLTNSTVWNPADTNTSPPAIVFGGWIQ